MVLQVRQSVPSILTVQIFAEKTLGIFELHGTQSAMDAIRLAVYKGGAQYSNDIVTLVVRNAHPVNFEFDALVLQIAARMKALEDSTTIGSGMLN